MGNVLNGIKNFVQFINDNWTAICFIVGVIIAICTKIKKYFKMSNEDKVSAAKKQIKEIILKLVTDAEIDYEDWVKVGAVKRSQVIEQIFSMYPILSTVVNQEDIIAWIDEMINEALKTVKEVFVNKAE